MSETMWGLDPEKVTELGRALARSADDLDSAARTGDGLVETAGWLGPSGQEFRGRWQRETRPSLTAAAEALRGVAETARRNAGLQTTASDSASGSSGGGPGPVTAAAALPGSAPGDGSGSGSGGDGDRATPGPGPGPVPPADRKPPADILQQYQVTPDEMYRDEDGNLGWKPSGWTVDLADWWSDDVDLENTDPVQITKKEAAMLDELGVFELRDFNDMREKAFGEGDARFASPDQNDDHNDAFRHAYWNALMAQRFGQDWAHDYGTAHEQLPGNNAPAREAMDLYNNEVGRRIQEQHPDASAAELADLVEAAVRNGEMVVVGPDGTSLVYSDQIASENTGEAKPAGAPIAGKDPEWKDES